MRHFIKIIGVLIAGIFVLEQFAWADTAREALAPPSEFVAGPATRRQVTIEDWLDFAKKFVAEVKTRLDRARSLLADYDPAERNRILRLTMDNALLKRVSAEMMPAFLANLMPMAMEDLMIQVYAGEMILKNKIAETFGGSYQDHGVVVYESDTPYFLDAAGDVMAILAGELLYNFTPEQMAQWSADEQTAAICVLGYNWHHIQLHQHWFEAIIPSHGTRDAGSETRPPEDPFFQHTLNVSRSVITKHSYEDSRLVDRLLLLASDEKRPKTAWSTLVQTHGTEGILPKILYKWITQRSYQPPFLDEPGIFAEFPLIRAFYTPNPAILEELEKTENSDMRNGFLRGLWVQHHLSNREAEEQWATLEGKKFDEKKHIQEFVELGGKVVKIAPTVPDPAYRLVWTRYSDAEKTAFPHLTGLTEKLAAPWAIPDPMLPKFEELIVSACANAFTKEQSHESTKPVIWSAKELQSLGDSYQLDVILYALFGDLFDIRQAFSKNGSCSVVLDPFFGKLKRSTLQKTIEANFLHYQRMQQILKKQPSTKIDQAQIVQSTVGAAL